MKNILQQFLLLVIFSTFFYTGCKKDNKVKTSIKKEENKNNEIKNANDPVIEFLNKKYQDPKPIIQDAPNPFPTYTFSDKKLGGFSIDYIGKANAIQYFWNVKNENGYFSKYPNPEDAAYQSDNIKKLLNTNDYYIIASYLPSKYISYIDKESDEFDLKPGAKTSFYLYENATWRLINETETSKIPEDVLAFEVGLIQKDKFNSINNSTENYDGAHSVSVETEANTTGMASISYNFNIKKGATNLSLTTYHESNLCDGKYFAIEKNNMLEVYYADDQLSCISIDPKFHIKKEGKKFYIKGVGGEATYNQWIIMK
ncbi:hypothetical protein MKS83_17170 [Chryseobacterium sp. Y16C]|uniref:hypothetical protein n=1 Tax=Chryseobacterium sp. Y16C TaxID=2920939 RepID=UPI001F0A3DAB|nr:hypothetical protein [Chryseobacterium sp. Y16C]UMQ41121.1 hypothetical protein MKS83_17170 [Chryseobacterium sp. Y16C]